MRLRLLAVVALVGCSSSKSAPDAGDAAVDASTRGVALRIVHLAPDLEPVDACLRPAGAAGFEGPVLRAAGQSGVAFGQGTVRVSVPAGTATVRLVPAAEATCDGFVTDDVRNLELGAASAHATLLLAGALQPSAGVAPFVARVLPDAAPAGTLRFVPAAAPHATLDFGRNASAGFAPIFLAVPFATASAARAEPADDGAAWAVRTHSGAAPLAEWSVAAAPAEAQRSFFVSSDAAGATRLLVCDDAACALAP
jgi:hypothetical protein